MTDVIRAKSRSLFYSIKNISDNLIFWNKLLMSWYITPSLSIESSFSSSCFVHIQYDELKTSLTRRKMRKTVLVLRPFSIMFSLRSMLWICFQFCHVFQFSWRSTKAFIQETFFQIIGYGWPLFDRFDKFLQCLSIVFIG